MTSVAQAQEIIRQRADALEAESVPLGEAHGRILREPVAAAEDVPPFDRSAMDGFAMLENDPANEAEVVGEIRAGETSERELRPGEAIRIFTGAQLPGPGLRVIMQEDVEAQAGRIRLVRAPGADSHVRRRGEDARAGEVLLSPGTPLDAAAVALLASLGKTSVLASRRPRVLHLTTGDEIVPPGRPLAPGQIRNSNAFLIAGLCREWGADGTTHLHAPDDLKAMTDLIAQAEPGRYDLLLISGGSGAGKYDFTARLFQQLKAEMLFQQVDVRPGKPLIFGANPAQLLFGLPGNALSHFVCFHLFVRAALGGLLARAPEAPRTATMAALVPDTANSRETWWPARLKFRDERVELRALPWKSSGDITRLPGADALIRVPARTARLSAGERVEYLPLRNH
jgi:molybdopterin molybdotransferase